MADIIGVSVSAVSTCLDSSARGAGSRGGIGAGINVVIRFTGDIMGDHTHEYGQV